MKRIDPRLAGMALLACAAVTCNVERNVLHEKVYGCDLKVVEPDCGTDQAGRPMMCFAGRTLGGTDFCAARCADGEGAGGPGAICAQSGARLATCDLSDGAGASCGNPALGCFRNNLLSDTGTCVTISPCDADRDCRDPVRSTCASTLVKKIYANPGALKNDHSWCLQSGCQERRTACSPGETCLRDLIPAAANPPDICVPSCDSNLRCPPAHFCYRKTSGPAAPAICIPGLLGFRCEATIDCLIGECVDTGYGFNLCSTKCGNDADCARFDGEQGRFACNESHQCVTPNAYRGSPCNGQSDCASGLACAFLSADSAQGNCLPPCEDGVCPARGGVPHTCLGRGASSPGVCYPGYFGYPCTADSACLGGLSCRSVAAGAPKICTALCADDGDCRRNRWASGGFCQELKDMGIKVCLTARATGQPCERNEQCQSARCAARGDGMSVCAAAGAGRP